MPRAFDRETIRNIVQQYAAAAGRAIEAGFDFIGLPWRPRLLADVSFLSPYCNKRDDEYGGDCIAGRSGSLSSHRRVRRVIGPGVPLPLNFG